MGLAERRAVKEFQDTQLPALRAEIFEALGFEVPLEIHWEQLAEDGASANYKSWWVDIYFKPLLEAFRDIARDDMGKEALKAGLKQIVLRNTGGLYVPSEAIKYEAGVLTIDHGLLNVEDIASRAAYMIEIMEKSL